MDLVNSEKAMRVWLLVSLICNMGIVVSGGIVRITGSGLGCPDWPRCTPDSFIPHGALGIHGAIEFGNRLLTFVLAAAALGAFVSVWRVAGKYSKLWWITLSVGIGIIVQAVVGGITVWVDLHPAFVAVHLVFSIGLIVISTWGVLLGRGQEPVVVGRRLHALTVVTFVVAMVSIATGTLTTGAGPHAGDAESPRNGLDIEAIARLHAMSAWAVVVMAFVCIVAFRGARSSTMVRVSTVFLGTVLLQGVIGYVQYFLGIPATIVWAHMAGLTLLTAAAAWLLFTGRAGRPVVRS